MCDCNEQVLTDLYRELVEKLAPDADREGLEETPKRVARAWRYWTSGYAAEKQLAEIFKTFADGAEGYDAMICESSIPFYSHCEHHLAPFFGTATVAYIPNKRVVGLSKISRVVDVFSRRLQVQERLTVQIADAIEQHLQPQGVGVFLTARHLCMESRGICKQGIETHTNVLRGAIKNDPKSRAEFMNFVRFKT